MKSLADLQKLREEAKKRLDLREGDNDYRVVVGMATCGIAAGARPVLNALVEESAAKNYNCTITQTGCIGMCTLEPIVEVFDKEGGKTTYVLMTPEKAVKMLESHILGGHVLEEYTVGTAKQ